MSVSTAIGGVSESLRNLLVAEMQLSPDVPVTILAPDEAGGERRINLFLYKVRENPHLNNMDWQVSREDSSQLTPPPLSLDLYYLMTPYADNDEVTGNTTSHEILGEAMRVFYEHAIVPAEHLAGELSDAREQIKVMQSAMDMEELSQVWGTFAEAFRLSVLYEVSVVQLDARPEPARPVPQRVGEISVPKVQAPFQPPVVHRIEPVSGAAGRTITLHGEHLEGRRATVTMLQEHIADGVPLSGDQLDVVLPGDLEPGVYELRVDVSQMFRRTFMFEVTG